MTRYYSSTAQPTTLSGSISSGATAIGVGAVTGFPSSYPYTLALDYGGATEELVDVTAAAGTSLTVTRAVDGTSAQSHSIGAVVKHVASARDFTDMQTHMSATTAIHGVAGTLVGTSDTQTLSNKTLSGGVLSGTFTGAPVLSGAVTLSGGGTLGGTFTGTPAFSGALTLSGGGALSGTFTGAPTLSGNLTFTGAPVFNTSSGVQFQRSTSASVAYKAMATGDASQRLQMLVDGTLQWGDGTSAQDTNLYRSAAATLKTDNSLAVAGSLTVSGVGGALFAYKSADTSRTSTVTPTSDPHLTLAVVANGVYELDGALFWTSTAAGSTPSLSFAVNGPTGTGGFWSGVGPSSVSTADPDTVRTIATAIGSNTRTYGIPLVTSGTAPAFGVHVRGLVSVGSTAGNITIDWSQNNTSAAALTLKQYSWLKLTRRA